jgi:hypothetical protein
VTGEGTGDDNGGAMADHHLYADDASPPGRAARRHPAITIASVLAALVVVGLVAAGVATIVRLASDARDQRAREEAEFLACRDDGTGAPAVGDGDTRNLCLYPDRPDRQPDDHEAELGASVRLAGLTATLEEGFMHELVLADQLTLRVTIHNRDDRPKTFGSTDWRVLDRRGTPISPTRSEREDALGTGELSPGTTVTGTIAYDLPAGTYYVVYRPEAVNQARGIWQVEVAPPD